MFKEAESRPDKIESTSNNVQARKKQQHRRRACDLLASLIMSYIAKFYSILNHVIHCKILLHKIHNMPVTLKMEQSVYFCSQSSFLGSLVIRHLSQAKNNMPQTERLILL